MYIHVDYLELLAQFRSLPVEVMVDRSHCAQERKEGRKEYEERKEGMRVKEGRSAQEGRNMKKGRKE